MKEKLEDSIKALQNLEDIKLRLADLEDELVYEENLLFTLLPWIKKKEQILDKSGNQGVFSKLFIKSENLLTETREQHHHMILRANKLKKKIELLRYEKGILKEKMAKKGQINYQLSQLIEEKVINTGDENYQLLLDLKFTNKKIKKNLLSIKELTKVIFLGTEVDGMFLQISEQIQLASMSSEVSFIQGEALQVVMKRKAKIQKAKNIFFDVAQKITEYDGELSHLLGSDKKLQAPFFSDVTLASLQQTLTIYQHKHTLLDLVQTYESIRSRVIDTVNALKNKQKSLELSCDYLKKEKEKLMAGIVKKS